MTRLCDLGPMPFPPSWWGGPPDHPGDQYDPSDRYDLDREWEVPAHDYTGELPPIPGTTDLHPIACACRPCTADREALAWTNDCDDDGAPWWAL